MARIFYQEIKEGDRRKIEGISNDDPEVGGGARDLRFPDSAFRPFFEKIFTGERSEVRTITDDYERSETITVRVGDVHWKDENGRDQVTEVEYWPPTPSRHTEGRIARISSLGALEGLPPEGEGRLFILITQYTNDEVWVRFASWSGIERGNKVVAEHIERCLGSTSGTHSVRGYIDFYNAQFYCHG